jgi:hypothetical protein
MANFLRLPPPPPANERQRSSTHVDSKLSRQDSGNKPPPQNQQRRNSKGNAIVEFVRHLRGDSKDKKMTVFVEEEENFDSGISAGSPDGRLRALSSPASSDQHMPRAPAEPPPWVAVRAKHLAMNTTEVAHAFVTFCNPNAPDDAEPTGVLSGLSFERFALAFHAHFSLTSQTNDLEQRVLESATHPRRAVMRDDLWRQMDIDMDGDVTYEEWTNYFKLLPMKTEAELIKHQQFFHIWQDRAKARTLFARVTPTKSFGVALSDLMELQADQYPDLKVPWVVRELISRVLASNGTRSEGIFRISALKEQLNELCEKLDRGYIAWSNEPPDLPACALKEWLRQLPEALIPQQLYGKCVDSGRAPNPEALSEICGELPEESKNVLRALGELFDAVVTDTEYNKMNVENLGIVFAPCFLRNPSTDPMSILANSRFEAKFTAALVQFILKRPPPPHPPPTSTFSTPLPSPRASRENSPRTQARGVQTESIQRSAGAQTEETRTPFVRAQTEGRLSTGKEEDEEVAKLRADNVRLRNELQRERQRVTELRSELKLTQESFHAQAQKATNYKRQVIALQQQACGCCQHCRLGLILRETSEAVAESPFQPSINLLPPPAAQSPVYQTLPPPPPFSSLPLPPPPPGGPPLSRPVSQSESHYRPPPMARVVSGPVGDAVSVSQTPRRNSDGQSDKFYFYNPETEGGERSIRWWDNDRNTQQHHPPYHAQQHNAPHNNAQHNAQHNAQQQQQQQQHNAHNGVEERGELQIPHTHTPGDGSVRMGRRRGVTTMGDDHAPQLLPPPPPRSADSSPLRSPIRPGDLSPRRLPPPPPFPPAKQHSEPPPVPPRPLVDRI